VGGRWVWGRSWHPDLGTATIRLAGPVHPVVSGLPDVVVDDETYCDLEVADDVTVLGSHRLDGRDQPGRSVTVVTMDEGLLARLAATRTIEITTVGRRSGLPRRIEIWWFRFEDRFVVTGTPGRRDWLANLEVDPRMTVHVLGQDLPASARPVTDPDVRRRFFTQGGTEVRWYASQAQLDELVDRAPMIEVVLEG